MFRLEMLPAAHGDCLWIEYGSGEAVHRVLIDGGPAHTYPALRERILHLPAGDRGFELLVVTHIDGDHIEGVVRLLQDAEVLGCRFQRIWFNGRQQLDAVPDPAGSPLGAVQGEILSLLVADLEERAGRRLLNTDFATPFVGIDRASAELPAVTLPGGLRLTLLSPDLERLLDLKDRWESELAKAGLDPGDERRLRRRLEEARYLQPLGDVLGGDDEQESRFEMPDAGDADLGVALADELGGGDDFASDQSPANGSSIALLAEHPDATLVLAGDAFAPVLAESIAALLAERGARKLKIDALKLAHHGSIGNVSPELLALLVCRNYLISTSGALYRHPHEGTVDLLLRQHQHRGRPRLHFNYRSVTTEPWADAGDRRGVFEAIYPKGISLLL